MSKLISRPSRSRRMAISAVFALSVLGLAPSTAPVAAEALNYPPSPYAPAAPGEATAPAAPLSAEELSALVAPVALYPDDLVSLVLPASTYPLQIVQAARFLAARKNNSSLRPDAAWDDSVVALLNYPEVINQLDQDLDWTWRLGQAVLNQQADVISAVADFRARAQAAGNLRSDERQIVDLNQGTIQIRPTNPQLMYVPYYEPTQVVVYQTAPVYHYYPSPYPVYYYDYPLGYPTGYSSFWGLGSAFSIGWFSRDLHVRHHHNRHHRDHHDGRHDRDHGDWQEDWRDSHGRGNDYVWQHDSDHGGARPGGRNDHDGRGRDHDRDGGPRQQAGAGRPVTAGNSGPPRTSQQGRRRNSNEAPAMWQEAMRQSRANESNGGRLTPAPASASTRAALAAPARSPHNNRAERDQAPRQWQEALQQTRPAPRASEVPASAAPNRDRRSKTLSAPRTPAPEIARAQSIRTRDQAPAMWQQAKRASRPTVGADTRSDPRSAAPAIARPQSSRSVREQAPATWQRAERASQPAGGADTRSSARSFAAPASNGSNRASSRQQSASGDRNQAPPMWQKAMRGK